MTWPLYMDHHVPWSVTFALRRRGFDVLTAVEDHAAELDDESLLVRATSLDRILVTRDRDFMPLTAEWRTHGRSFSTVVAYRRKRLGHAELIEWLELIASVLRQDEVHNRMIFVPMT